MSGKMYGYARVSTRNQNEDRQLVALKQFGVLDENIIVEKQSGKDFLRPLYLRMVKKMAPGDVLVVKSIDRLGRCTSQQKLDTNFNFFYSKDWFYVQCLRLFDTFLFGWLDCIRYFVIVKPACAPLTRLRA